MRPLPHLLALLALLVCLTPGAASARGSASHVRTVDELVARVVSLSEAIRVVEEAERQASPEDIDELREKLDGMRTELRARQRGLHRLITGMEPRFIDIAGEDADVEWEDEARALLSPLFLEFREATELPRRVGRLRRRVAFLQSSLPQIEHAMVNAAEAMHTAPDEPSRKALDAIRKDWLTKRDEIAERLEITRVELSRLEEEQSGVGEAGTRLWRLLKQDRTQRLALALLAFLATFLSSHLVHRVLARVPLLRRIVGDGMGMRVIGLTVHLLGSVGAVSILLIVLYSSGDWVLLTLAVVVIVSLALGARSAAPRFLREIALLLNAGAVRQGERIVWNGVPWRVQSLQLTTTLSNPAFPEGQTIRLPLRALDELVSRPGGDDEPWFPTRLWDWVEWDGLAAQVTRQGPEFVELDRDRSKITIPTPEFLAASPTNLSEGFRHRVVLKLDRRHEKDAPQAIPERLTELLLSKVASHPSGKHLVTLGASFEAISSWSFDIEVEADFTGAAAAHWEELMELIQRGVLEACLSEGWTIARSDYVR